MDEDEAFYKEQYDYMEQEFKDAKFCVCFSIDELDEVISKEKSIVVVNTFCFCYGEALKGRRRFYVIHNDKMTLRNIIHSLIEQGIEPKCNHQFLEGIDAWGDNDTQFELSWGS